MSTVSEYTESAVVDMVKKFLTTFSDNGQFKYVEQIDQMYGNNKPALAVNFIDLVGESTISDEVINNPEATIKAFSRAIKEILQERHSEFAEYVKEKITVRFSGVPTEVSFRELDSESANKLISINGIIVTTSETVRQIPKIAVFACSEGHNTTYNFNFYEPSSIQEVPAKCPDPKCTSRQININMKESTFTNFRSVEIQPDPRSEEDYKNPTKFMVLLPEDLMYFAQAGDRIIVTGIPKLVPVIRNQNALLFITNIYANNLELLSPDGRIGRKVLIEISDEEEKRIINFSKQYDIKEQLTKSFAPHIKMTENNQVIREALLLALVGGNEVVQENGTRIRGDINVLLVGDPGMTKTQLSLFAVRVAPKGYYVTGMMSSGPGLSAAVVKERNENWKLYPGAAVLADQGVLVIDEFDKLKKEDRAALHEIMEQQTVSPAKATITTRLNARDTVICACNPQYERYDPFRNLNENISMPIPLLTRFDLIFVIRDIPNVKTDTEIFNYMAKIRRKNNKIEESGIFDVDFMTKYLWYARKTETELDEEAEELLQQQYVKVRQIESDDALSSIFTARYAESLMRLTEANAKLELRNVATKEDAKAAIEIHEKMLQNAAIDVNTGKVEIGVLQGKPKEQLKLKSAFIEIIKTFELEHNFDVPTKDLAEKMVETEHWDSIESARLFIKDMTREGMIMGTIDGHIRRVGVV